MVTFSTCITKTLWLDSIVRIALRLDNYRLLSTQIEQALDGMYVYMRSLRMRCGVGVEDMRGSRILVIDVA